MVLGLDTRIELGQMRRRPSNWPSRFLIRPGGRRQHRNMLVCAAADQRQGGGSDAGGRRTLAWRSLVGRPLWKVDFAIGTLDRTSGVISRTQFGLLNSWTWPASRNSPW